MLATEESSLVDMQPFQVFVPDPVDTNFTRSPEAESKLLNVMGVEDGVMLHVGLNG